MKSKQRVPVMFVVALAAVAGCGSSDATGPSSSNSLDLSALISEMGIGSTAFALSSAAGGAIVPAMPPALPSSCAYSASTQGFTCATVSVDGLTFNTTFFLLDGNGHFQSQPDASTTAAIRTVSDLSGTLANQPGSNTTMTLSSHQDQTLSGLLTGAHVLNGTATSHSDITLTGAAAMHEVVDSKAVTANVSIPKSSKWPTSGSVTTDATSTTQIGSQSVNGTAHSVLAFNGSSTVTMTTTVTTGSSSISINCKIDLSGASTPVCS